MDIVFVFVEPSEVEGDGPVRIIPDTDRGILFVIAAKGMDENTLGRELSLAVTLHARESWIYAGNSVDAA